MSVEMKRESSLQNKKKTYLDIIFKSAAHIEELDLSKSNITDLNEVLPLLVKFPRLLTVNLEDNHINDLPLNMNISIDHVRELNINNNPFKSIEQVVKSLQKLPNLMSLYMSLFQEDTVHLVITQLSQIQFLNGIEIQRKEVHQNAQGNLINLKQDLSQPDQSSNATVANQNRNQILPLEQIRETDEDEIQSATPYSIHLESLTTDQHQSINFGSQKPSPKSLINSSKGSQKILNQQQPQKSHLSSLNEVASQLFLSQEMFTNNELEKISHFYELIGQILKTISTGQQAQMNQEFEDLLNQIINNLNDCLQKQVPSSVKQTSFLQAKSSLIELCLKKIFQYLQLTHNPMCSIFSGLMIQSQLLVQQIFNLLQENEIQHLQQIKSLNQQISDIKGYYSIEQQQMDQKLQELSQEYHQYQQKLKSHNRNISEPGLMTSGQSNFSQTYQHISYLQTPMSIELLEQNTSNMNSPPNELSNTQPLHLSQNDISFKNDTFKKRKQKTLNQSFDYTQRLSSAKIVKPNEDVGVVLGNKSMAMSPSSPVNQSFTNPHQVGSPMSSDIKNLTNLNSRELNKQSKAIGLKQLKEFINDIFVQKVKYDQKCKELQMPIETIEQYLYTYLTKRYGLKNLIVQWAATIINAVKMYVKADADVALFAKCLKNECDQEFRQVQEYVKDQVIQALKFAVKEKYNTKSEGDIINIIDLIKQNQVKLEKWMWTKTLGKLYNTSERSRLQQIMNQFIKDKGDTNDEHVLNEKDFFLISPSKERRQSQSGRTVTSQTHVRRRCPSGQIQKQDQSQSNSGLNASTELIPLRIFFADFQNIILEAQLRQHELYLHPFNDIFKHVDKDQNGILNYQEFKQLMQLMEFKDSFNKGCNILNEISVHKLIQQIDPFSHKQITYGQILYALANAKTVQATSPIKIQIDGSSNNDQSSSLLQLFLQQYQLQKLRERQTSETNEQPMPDSGMSNNHRVININFEMDKLKENDYK